MHVAKTVVDILLVLGLHFLQMALQALNEIYRQHRNAIFSTFTFANRDSRVTEIDILHPVRYLHNLVFMYRLPQADFRYFSR